MMDKIILAVDQGTSGTKAIVYTPEGVPLAKGFTPVKTNYPASGFVEQSPIEIVSSCIESVKRALENLESATDYNRDDIFSCAITNQRESFLLWDAEGVPLSEVISWQCKRSVDICREIKSAGKAGLIREKTGLPVDPYFSASKLTWLLRNKPALKKRNDVYFGTIDTWLLFFLTGGQRYASDFTNACRTQLFDIHSLAWDHELVYLYEADNIKFPELLPSDAEFGRSDFNGLFKNKLPIHSVIGDSHAAAFGELCFEPGAAKITMGTGSSLLMNVGNKPVKSCSGMAETLCYTAGTETVYALEGIIVSCGSLITWLKDSLGIIEGSADLYSAPGDILDSGGVQFVPALGGLGAPFWKMDEKGSFHGLGFDTSKAQILHSVFESIAFQEVSVIRAMEADAAEIAEMGKNGPLYIDGGVSGNPLIMKMIASLLGRPVHVVLSPDTSPLGAMLLACLGSGIYNSINEIQRLELPRQTYIPTENDNLQKSYHAWESTVKRS